MYTVSCRVKGHDVPIVPIVPLSKRLLDECGASLQNVALLHYITSQEHGIA